MNPISILRSLLAGLALAAGLAWAGPDCDWIQRCGRADMAPDLAKDAAQAARMPAGFTLHSAVIVGVAPLLPLPLARATPPPGSAPGAVPAGLHSGNNVRLRVSPWAYVRVDGKRWGVTPALTQLKLSPGSHTVELSNPGFEVFRKVVRLPQDAPVVISHDFEARW